MHFSKQREQSIISVPIMTPVTNLTKLYQTMSVPSCIYLQFKISWIQKPIIHQLGILLFMCISLKTIYNL